MSFKQGKLHSIFKLNIANHINQSSHFQIPDLPSLVHCLEMVQFISDQLKISHPELVTHQAHTMPTFSQHSHTYYLIFTTLRNRQKQLITITLEMKNLRLVYTLAQKIVNNQRSWNQKLFSNSSVKTSTAPVKCYLP